MVRNVFQAYRVTLVTHALPVGGAERVLTLLANHWAEKGWIVTVITLAGGKPFFVLDSRVQLRQLALGRMSRHRVVAAASGLRGVRLLRKEIVGSAPEVVVSFLARPNILTLLACLGLQIPVIISERNNPKARPMGSWLWRTLRSVIYPGATALVVQTQTVLRSYPRRMRKKARVIPNPVVAPPSYAETTRVEPRDSFRAPVVVAMGKMNGLQKGFDLLLRAFAQINQRHPEWRLVVWGDGPMRCSLGQLRDELGLRGCVRFPGRTEHAFSALRQAELFVLSSRYEGFPNVLCEAMACGLPVISFDCPHGPSDIIRDGVDGILVPPDDVLALADAMEHLMSDDQERRRLGSRAREITERFPLERVSDMWEALFAEPTSRCANTRPGDGQRGDAGGC